MICIGCMEQKDDSDWGFVCKPLDDKFEEYCVCTKCIYKDKFEPTLTSVH